MDPSLLKMVKLAHHASEEAHGQDHSHDPLDPKAGIVNPVSHGLASMARPAFWMAFSLTAFTAVLKVAAIILPMVGIAVPDAGFGSMLANFSVAGLAGAIYGAATGFYQGYSHATQHNQRVTHSKDEPEIERAQARSKTVERSLTHAPRKGVIMGGLPEHDLHADAPAHDHKPEHKEPKPAPKHVQKIIDSGPRSLSPKELATRIHEERTASKHAGV